jgi:hypothetical protein
MDLLGNIVLVEVPANLGRLSVRASLESLREYFVPWFCRTQATFLSCLPGNLGLVLEDFNS